MVFPAISEEPEISASPNLPFATGEVLIFDVSIFFKNIGTTTMTYHGLVPDSTQPLIHITSITDVVGFYDVEEVYGDPLTFLPIRVERTIGNGEEPKRITEYYNPQEGSVRIVNEVTGEQTEFIKKEKPLSNIILLYYYFRTLDLEKGKKFKLTLPYEDVTMRVALEKKVEVPFGELDSYFLKCKPNILELYISKTADPLPLFAKYKGTFTRYSLKLNKWKKPTQLVTGNQ